MTAVATKQAKKQTAKFKGKATSNRIMETNLPQPPQLSLRSPTNRCQRECLADWEHAS